MRYFSVAIGLPTALFGILAVQPNSSQVPFPEKPSPMILAANEGEQREFRTRPGVTFTLKIGPKNGGSESMAVVTEDMAPGDKIPTHKHPHADELIFIQSGTGQVTVGDHTGTVRAGAIVFIPRDTWISLENIGTDRLTHSDVWSLAGHEEYMRAISVPIGQPIIPMSSDELLEIRKKYTHFAIFK